MGGTFSVVRNPWDKVVSHYHYRFKRNKTGIAEQGVSFGDWVRLTYRDQDPRYLNNPRMFMPQLNWLVDVQGRVVVDRILRFERLHADFADLQRDLKRSHVALPHVKPSQRGPYQGYYDAETREIVARWFRRDILYFEYSYVVPER